MIFKVAHALAHIDKCIKSVVSFIDEASAAVTDACLLQQYEEKVADVHHDLAKVALFGH